MRRRITKESDVYVTRMALLTVGTVVAAGTTAALILFSRKWERHRDKKKQGSFNGGNVFRFFEAWGVGFFKTAMTIGQFKYPRTPACSQVDTYPGGYNVSDPYAWLEDSNDPKVQEWLAAQLAYTKAHFDSALKPYRENFREKYEQIHQSFVEVGCPIRRGKRYFFWKRRGSRTHPVLFKQLTLKGEASILLDPNDWIGEIGGGSTIFDGRGGGYSFSKDGGMLAYCKPHGKSDNLGTIFVRDVNSSEDIYFGIPDCVCSSTIEWAEDGMGFFYCGYSGSKELLASDGSSEETLSSGRQLELKLKQQGVYFHRLGTDPALHDDIVVYKSEDDEELLTAELSHCYKTLLITSRKPIQPTKSMSNTVFYCDLSSFDGINVCTMGPLVKLIDSSENSYDYVTNKDRIFWFRTNLEAPRYKVISLCLPSIGSPTEKDSEVLRDIPQEDAVPQHSTAVLEKVQASFDSILVLLYQNNACHQLVMCKLDHSQRTTLDISDFGSIAGFSAHVTHNEVFYKFTSFTHPGSAYRVKVGNPTAQRLKMDVYAFSRDTVTGLDLSEFETKQLCCKSADGTLVSAFLVSHKGCQGTAPCLLYGFGGFGYTVQPTFNIGTLIFIRHFGGRYCSANIRGGLEHGKEWHRAGTLDNKQNVFDDFQAVAQYLCTTGLTTPQQLAIRGSSSNGGLTVGACVNQQPELFACAVCDCGIFDMLKFHKCTGDKSWVEEYGCAETDVIQFKTLRAYSPVHTVSGDSEKYPAILLTTCGNCIVPPLHSYKYLAALQATIGRQKKVTNPIVIQHITSKASHGMPERMSIEDASNIYTFIAKYTNAIWVK